MSPEDLFKQLEEQQKKQREAAMSALTFFVSKYSPAIRMEEADTFFTSTEISQAIAEHTGFTLSTTDIYELMTNMGYSSEVLNSLEFNWLLKK